jgi:hypothetical protein
MLDLSLVLPVSTKDCISMIQILSTKDYLSRFPIQLFLYLSLHLLLLIFCALFTFTPFLNFYAQLLKPQTFLDGGSSKEQKNTNIVGNQYM